MSDEDQYYQDVEIESILERFGYDELKRKADLWDKWKPVTCFELFDKLEAIKQVVKDVDEGQMSPYDGEPLDAIKEILQSSGETTNE